MQHQELIQNGFPTKEGDWPWHSAIFHITGTTRDYKCGGTLIDPRTVLTAAHCLYDIGRPIVAERVIVQLGKYNRELSSPHTQEIQAHRLVIHGGYNREDFLHDIAVIRLSAEAAYTSFVQPVCLWDANRVGLDEVVHRNGIVVGWGINENKQLLDVLSQASMPVVSFAECLAADRAFFGLFLSDNTYCAGFRNGA